MMSALAGEIVKLTLFKQPRAVLFLALTVYMADSVTGAAAPVIWCFSCRLTVVC